MRVTVTNGRGRPVRDEGLAQWLAAVAPARARGEVAVALASDLQVCALNRRYRRRNAPTDVLSFTTSATRAGTAAADRTNARRASATRELPFLGDIVIATGVAKRQAREHGHTYRTELRVLALHGLLHLLGYDHDDPRDRGAMFRVEARLRRKGGLKEGLIGRTRP